ncbi:MAG TPA: SAM-dependent methyltransferase [Solirubrobacterales bacterium]|nr:SAM-dependent methyltransferase [Solirubrobacterales bacterium]
MTKGNYEKPSATALGNLALACMATSERDPSVRGEDTFARCLLAWNDGAAAAARIRLLHPVLRAATERFLPGIYGFGLARAKHMDRVLREEIEVGIDSLVILGAGYDTRAYRLRAELADVRVFEVDNSATSRDKRRRVGKVLGAPPGNVSFVEADLARDGVGQRLTASGYDATDRTLFLLCGVSMYLSAEAMASLLDEIGAHKNERTSLLFDFVDARVLTEPDRFFGKEWIAHARKVGEEPRWGIPLGGVAALLESHDLLLASSLDAGELTTRYLRREDGSVVARPFDFGTVAHALARKR